MNDDAVIRFLFFGGLAVMTLSDLRRGWKLEHALFTNLVVLNGIAFLGRFFAWVTQ
jgi:hypothetical protein